MFVGDSRRPMGPGVLALQHQNYTQTGWTLGARICLMGVRAIDRETTSGLHHLERGSTGDLTGAALWRENTREIPGWRFSWPVVTGRSGPVTKSPLYGPPKNIFPTTPRTPSDSAPPTTGYARNAVPSPPPQTAYIPAGSTINVGGTMVTVGSGLFAGGGGGVPVGAAFGGTRLFAQGGGLRSGFGLGVGDVRSREEIKNWARKQAAEARRAAKMLEEEREANEARKEQERVAEEKAKREEEWLEELGHGKDDKKKAKPGDGQKKDADETAGQPEKPEKVTWGEGAPWLIGDGVKGSQPWKVGEVAGAPFIQEVFYKRDEDGKLVKDEDGNPIKIGYSVGQQLSLWGFRDSFSTFTNRYRWGFGDIQTVSKRRGPRKKIAPAAGAGHKEAAWFWFAEAGVASGGLLSPPPPLYPIGNFSWEADARYDSTRDYSVPMDWPSLPEGFAGIAMPSTNEEDQELLFHPTDPRLIAVNDGPEGKYGSLVCDTDGANGVNAQRSARLQSFFYVVPKPTGTSACLKANRGVQNWLSWNIGPAGNWDTHGGLMTDVHISGAGENKKTRIHAVLSIHEGGPFDVGEYKDVHRLGKDEDGLPINCLHLSTRAPFIRHPGDGPRSDGPLFFELIPYEEGDDLDEPLKVHLSHDPQTAYWKWWTTTTIYTPPSVPTHKEPPPTTDDDDPPGPGTETPGPTGGPPGGVPTGPGGGPNRIPDDTPGTIPGGWRVDPKSGTPYRWGQNSGTLLGAMSAGYPITTKATIGDASLLSPASMFGNRKQPASAYREHSYPSLSFRPQRIEQGKTDMRFGTSFGREERMGMDLTTPTVLRMEAYGAQGGARGGPFVLGPPGSGEHVAGDPWAYKQQPGASRHVGGTSGGGLAFIPPEWDMQHVDFMCMSHVPLSHHVIATPGVAYSWGSPELASGGLRDGYSMTLDKTVSPGELVVSIHDGEGNPTEVDRLGPSGWDRMRWQGAWVAGAYKKNDVVRDGEWTMVALADTEDRAAPQPQGNPAWLTGFDDNPPWSYTTDNVVQSITGVRLLFSEARSVYRVRIWIDYAVNVTYEVILVEDPFGTPRRVVLVPEFSPTPQQDEVWIEVPVGSPLIPPGTTADVLLVGRSKDTPTSFSYDWDYQRSNGDPGPGEAYTQNNNRGDLRIHEEDDTATDRSAQLDLIVAGSTIEVTGMLWDVLSATKVGDVYYFDVVPATDAAVRGVTTFTFTYTAAAAIRHPYVTDHWLGNLQVRGLKSTTNYPGGISVTDDAYGVDVYGEAMQVSDDWDVVALSGGVASQQTGLAISHGAQHRPSVVARDCPYVVEDGVETVIVTDHIGDVTLPDAAYHVRREIVVKGTGSPGSWRFDVVSAGGLIDGGTSVEIRRKESLRFVSDGTDWWIVGGS